MDNFSDKKKRNKIVGMFYGLAIGDVLGIPHEFKNFTPKLPYTGLIHQVDGVMSFRFCSRSVPKNVPSDDTRMTIALFKGLIATKFKNNGPDDNTNVLRDSVLKEYLKWAQIDSSMGKHTRSLMKGVTTIKGYERRFAKLENTESLQSNGSLMRISPMVLIEDDDECFEAIKMDTYLTNPNVINGTINNIYVQILRCILYADATKDEIAEVLEHWIELNDKCQEYQTISNAIKDALNGKKRDISINKGWVINAFYVTLYAFFACDNFQDTMDYVIGGNPNSDTDTNAAIAGALCGLYYGCSQLLKESKTSKNIKYVDKSPEMTELCGIFKDLMVENEIE